MCALYLQPERYVNSFGFDRPYLIDTSSSSSSSGAKIDFRQKFMKYTEVAAFQKTIQECGTSQDVTWSVRAPTRGLPSNTPCTMLTCQTALSTCFSKTFSVKHLTGTTRVSARYIKSAVCSPMGMADGRIVTKCTVKKIVYSCTQCDIRKRTPLETTNNVLGLLNLLSQYTQFTSSPEEATLNQLSCVSDAQLAPERRAGECSNSNLVAAAIKG